MAPAMQAETNGDSESIAYGANVVNGLLKQGLENQNVIRKLSAEEELVLKSFRLLIADLCQQFNGGHPGSVSVLSGILRIVDI